MEWMLMPLRRYAEFSGRSRRKEYWMFTLLNVIVVAILAMLVFSSFPFAALNDPAAAEAAEPGALTFVGMALGAVWVLGTIIPSIAVGVRRLHDRNMSGWWYLAFVIGSAIPMIGMLVSIALLVLMALPGTVGPNRFGPDPKDPAQAEVFA